MSQENVELARAALAAWVEVDEGLIDTERLEQFFTRDVVTTMSGFMPEEVTLRGFDEFLEVRAAWMGSYDDFLYEPEKILEAGANQVVVTLYQRGRPHGSDSWVDMHYGLVYTVEEGLISRGDFYATPEEALEAAGLSE
jgi:ketosteroid isomerase-like protein